MAARVTNPTHLADLAGRGLITRAGSGTAAQERTLPLLPVFAPLVPNGAVQRGSVVGCAGAAAVTLALAVAAGPSQQGAWVAVAGMPSLGLGAAAEAGVVLERLVAVTEPVDAEGAVRPFDDDVWGDLLAACIDGFDVVLLGPATQQVRPATARRLVARLQARGAVAVTVGAPVFGADLRFECAAATWSGLGDGYGVARERRAQLELSGRRVPQVRRLDCWLPAADGRMQASESAVDGTVLPLRRTG
jgi:hypothetical protein